MKTLKNLFLIGGIASLSLIGGGCEKHYKLTQGEIDYIYKKEVKDKIKIGERLSHLNDLMKNGKCKEAYSYLDTFLVDFLNGIESYQSTTINGFTNDVLSDSVRINLDEKLDLIQNKVSETRYQ